jgi:magnesium transporter
MTRPHTGAPVASGLDEAAAGGPWSETTFPDGSVWIDLDQASEAVLAELGRRFGFHRLALEDAASELQRPKVDVYDGYLFAVLHLPEAFAGSELRAWELNAFLAPRVLVTHARGHPPLAGHASAPEPHAGIDLAQLQLYEILTSALGRCEPLLDEIAEALARLDRETARADRVDARTVGQLSQAKQQVISYRRRIGPDRTAVGQLERAGNGVVGDAFRPYLADVRDTIERVWEQLAGFKEVAEGLEDTNESRLAHRQNAILQRLTVISVLGLPLALASGMLGMNVGGIPLRDNSGGFWILTGVFALVAAVLAVLFKRLDWF